MHHQYNTTPSSLTGPMELQIYFEDTLSDTDSDMPPLESDSDDKQKTLSPDEIANIPLPPTPYRPEPTNQHVIAITSSMGKYLTIPGVYTYYTPGADIINIITNIINNRYPLLKIAKTIIIWIGGNDVENYHDIQNFKTAYTNLLQIIQRNHHVKIILLTPCPRRRSLQTNLFTSTAINNYIKYHQNQHLIYTIDVWDCMMHSPTNTNSQCFARDGVHLSHYGLQIVTDKVSDVLEKIYPTGWNAIQSKPYPILVTKNCT